MQGTSNWNIRLSCINSFETRRIIINGPIARKLESRDATRSRITEPMFTTLESYSVIDSIASRLRVTVSPRIISRNLDLRDIETLPLNLDLYHLNPRWTTSRVSTFGFSSFKNPILDESARFSIEPPNFPATIPIQTQHFSKT